MNKQIQDSIDNLKFNLATITRNKGCRGVIFKETRDLYKHIDNKSREPHWKQLIDLIELQIMKLEIQLEELEELEQLKISNNGLINNISDRCSGVCIGNGSDSLCSTVRN